MPRQGANSAGSKPDQFFAKELSGETPPFLFHHGKALPAGRQPVCLEPWDVLDETELVLTRDSATGETCYCSVMGALGQVLAVHAYIGTEGYRQFRRVAAGEIAGAGEFYERQHSVYVEFVPRAELDGQDRKLLTAMGHPLGAVKASPIFRANRPGFRPWFVTEEEGRLLAECLHAVIVICSVVSTQPGLEYWNRVDYLSDGFASGGKRGPASRQRRISKGDFTKGTSAFTGEAWERATASVTQPELCNPRRDGTRLLPQRRADRVEERAARRARGSRWSLMPPADSSFRRNLRLLEFLSQMRWEWQSSRRLKPAAPCPSKCG